MKNIIAVLFLIVPFIGESQHTFSIVAIDSITGEIGSAGATCGDSIIWPGTPGALLISDIIPGVGAIHTQAFYHPINQSNAHARMLLGDSPQDIITWIVANDVSSDPLVRQYGIVDYNDGNIRSSAYTGANCFNYKNHILGPNYSIQGNILLGQEILDSMESRFNNTEGCLSDKLMAAMQGAKVIGADTRCTVERTSSLSAFLRVSRPTDHPDSLTMDLNIAGTPVTVEPIDELQTKYNNWKNSNANNCSKISSNTDLFEEISNVEVYPNPTNGLINIKANLNDITNVIVTDIFGDIVMSKKLELNSNEIIQISLDNLNFGTYIIVFIQDDKVVTRKKITIFNTN